MSVNLKGIQIGQKARTRDGREVTLVEITKGRTYPYSFLGPDGRRSTYTETGEYWATEQVTSSADLVALIPSPTTSAPIDLSTAKPGDQFRAKDGTMFTFVSEREDTVYPYLLESDETDTETFTQDGFYFSDKRDEGLNLVEALQTEQPPEIDLSTLAPDSVVRTRSGKKLLFKGERVPRFNEGFIYPYYCSVPGSDQKLTYTKSGKYTNFSGEHPEDIVEILSTGPEQPDAVTQDGTVFDFKTRVGAGRNVAQRSAVADRAALAMEAADAQATRDLANAGITDVRNIPTPSNPLPPRDTTAYGTEHLDRMRSLRDAYRAAMERTHAGLSLLLEATEARSCGSPEGDNHPARARANRKLRSAVEDAFDDIDKALRKHMRRVEKLMAEEVS